jgi:hypothetical protein
MTFEEIHLLIKRGDVIALRRELDSGLDPNLSNKHSWSLLMLAALEGNTQLGDLLISRGADVNKRNKLGNTALSLAAHKGFLSFVQLLLDRGASPRMVSRSWLMVASGLPEKKIVAILDLIKTYRKRKFPSMLDRCVNALVGLIVGALMGMLLLYLIMVLAGSDFRMDNVRLGAIIGAAAGLFCGWWFPDRWYWHLFP